MKMMGDIEYQRCHTLKKGNPYIKISRTMMNHQVVNLLVIPPEIPDVIRSLYKYWLEEEEKK